MIQSLDSPLARCLTLDELISLSKPYFYINKMDCELLINDGMQSVYHSVWNREGAQVVGIPIGLDNSLQFPELLFWLALKEIAECILLRKSVPRTLTLFPSLSGHIKR